MRTLLVMSLFTVGLGACAPANYVYNFDIANPGAKNLTKPGQRDQLEDGDLKAEVLVDPTSFQAILVDLTNKTDAPMQVNWAGIYVIAPDHSQSFVHPDAALGPIDASVRAVARLIPFSLPPTGPAALAYDQSKFELVIPMNVRGEPREYRLNLVARVKRL